jgi:hypothetical protein
MPTHADAYYRLFMLMFAVVLFLVAAFTPPEPPPKYQRLLCLAFAFFAASFLILP